MADQVETSRQSCWRAVALNRACQCHHRHPEEFSSEYAPIRLRQLPRLGCLVAHRHGHPCVVVVAGIRPASLTEGGRHPIRHPHRLSPSSVVRDPTAGAGLVVEDTTI